MGEIEELTHLPEGSERIFDDFDMNKRGEAYIGLQFDSLAKITQDRKVITLIGPDSEIKLLRPTSTLLSKDERNSMFSLEEVEVLTKVARLFGFSFRVRPVNVERKGGLIDFTLLRILVLRDASLALLES